MAKSDTPDENTRLRMENDLLAIQARVLRARIADTDDGLRLKQDEIDRLREAEHDVRLIVRRLGGSFLGWILRRRKGWRNLEEKWR